MRTPLSEIARPVTGMRARRATLRVPSGIVPDLGPFVVRRFVDFALTESMMCRLSA
ncbi:hypothetical protein GCM10011575_07700 [Microlunatus endophyticus]|uniref:Uncharacterized protein n=1 Tax=Microlunatus endophyticus TaxID=1716077 RepID=A0A917S309_9ACTN|nr:hypothetical protein [Microlunatus endophyticus]GGL51887.1 hypothetical protein GCM10011575_07700 [Microlunatus endophyticus]